MSNCKKGAAVRTNKKEVLITYPINMGVDQMEEQQKNADIEAEQQAEFYEMLKTGIYKSLCAEGIISQSSLMQLLAGKDGETR